MERIDFLKMCQKVSAVECEEMPDEFCVMFNGIKYIPYGYEMKFYNGNPIHNAILKRKNENAIIYANLERVAKIEQK